MHHAALHACCNHHHRGYTWAALLERSSSSIPTVAARCLWCRQQQHRQQLQTARWTQALRCHAWRSMRTRSLSAVEEAGLLCAGLPGAWTATRCSCWVTRQARQVGRVAARVPNHACVGGSWHVSTVPCWNLALDRQGCTSLAIGDCQLRMPPTLQVHFESTWGAPADAAPLCRHGTAACCG